jgi:UDP-N-acetyl-D-glucosamine dehydrogenase
VSKTINRLQQLKAKNLDRTSIVNVIGLGYVGLPFAVEKAKVGFQVIDIERNLFRTQQVNSAANYINDIDDKDLKAVVDSGHLKAVSGFEQVPSADVLVICVPTPLTKNMTPDLSYIEGVAREIANKLRPRQLITLESTTYPGTTDEVIRPILEKSGFKQGEDFFMRHSPERVGPGDQRYTTKNTNKVVGASDPDSLDVAMLFYK